MSTYTYEEREVTISDLEIEFDVVGEQRCADEGSENSDDEEQDLKVIRCTQENETSQELDIRGETEQALDGTGSLIQVTRCNGPANPEQWIEMYNEATASCPLRLCAVRICKRYGTTSLREAQDDDFVIRL